MNDLTGMYWDDNGNIVDSTAEYHHSLLNDFTISALFNHPTEDIDCHAQTEGWDLESTEADVVATPMSLSSEANTMMDRSKALFNQARCHLRRRDTIPDDSNRSDHDIGTPHSNTPPTIHLPTDSHIQSVSPTSDYKKDEVKTKDMPIIDLTTDTNQQNRQPSEASDKTEELDGEHKIPDMESDTLIRRLTERVRRLEEQLMQKEDMSESMYSHQCRPGPIGYYEDRRHPDPSRDWTRGGDNNRFMEDHPWGHRHGRGHLQEYGRSHDGWFGWEGDSSRRGDEPIYGRAGHDRDTTLPWQRSFSGPPQYGPHESCSRSASHGHGCGHARMESQHSWPPVPVYGINDNRGRGRTVSRGERRGGGTCRSVDDYWWSSTHVGGGIKRRHDEQDTANDRIVRSRIVQQPSRPGPRRTINQYMNVRSSTSFGTGALPKGENHPDNQLRAKSTP